MKIKLLGAAGGEVTGSAYLVQTDRANVMIDCGQFQGAKKLENSNRLPQKASLDKLNAVVVTHGHLDHVGRLPILARQGYRGPVYATAGTIEVSDLVLRDSARLQTEDAKRKNRDRKKNGEPPMKPLYEEADVQKVSHLYTRLRYEKPLAIAPGITVRAVDAGHILGSASIELTVQENGKSRVVVFSGDLGPRGAPLHKDPTPFHQADLVFMESTYGNKDHPSLAETAAEARELIGRTIEAGGRVLVPSFAVARTQILLYLLAGAFKKKLLEPFPIYLDSPMGIKATELYRKHEEVYDEEALAMRRAGDLSKHLRTVSICKSGADSRKLGKKPGPWLVMAGSGMCTGGRIMGHLQNHLPDPTTLLLMVGYQARGSVGRAILEGAKSVRINGVNVGVRAKAHMLGGLSGHAAQKDLLNWLGTIVPSRPRVILAHGEDPQRTALRDCIKQRFGLDAEMPGYLETIDF
jgi:metallo-beta-lactamase family protein